MRARSKTLLLSVSASGVSCLSDLTGTESAPEPSFADAMAEAMAEPSTEAAAKLPTHAVIELPQTESPKADIAEALARLSRLSA